MNNSHLKIEELQPEVDRKPALREREGELVKIIEALRIVNQTAEWSSLKTYVFDGLVKKLKGELLHEARKDSPSQLAKLNGQLVWAEKYADLEKLANSFRDELTRIRQLLYGSAKKES